MAYKFRLYPTATQTKALEAQLETLRQVYKTTLMYWRDLYEAEQRSPKANELYKLFSTLRNLQRKDRRAGGAGPHWLANVPATAIRDTCKRVKKAFENFFRRLKQKAGKAGYPRFKPRGRLTSIPFDNYAAGCTLRDASGKKQIQMVPPARKGYRLDVCGVGRIRVLAHRKIEGTIKTACVERDVDGKWYAVLVAQHEAKKKLESTNPPVGIDMGLENFLTRSDGIQRPNPRYLKSGLKVLRRHQRSACRKMEAAKRRVPKRKFRECKNLQKQFRKVAKLHVRVRNLRKDHHHKEAKLLLHEFGTVCVEKLSIRGMMRNGKLARAISDAAWGGFLIVLKHKAAKAGVRFVEVDASGISQTCPQCSAMKAKKLHERRHRCPCGLDIHRDHAAALVILVRGTGSNPAGPVGASRVNDPNPVGMLAEQSDGGRGGRRKANAKTSASGPVKASRSRKRAQNLTTPTTE